MKSVLITGATGTIGMEICKIFYKNKWKLYGTTTTKEGEKKIRKLFPKMNICITDFTKPTLLVKFVGYDPDVVINNAGTKYDFENCIKVNVKMPYRLITTYTNSKFINIISDIVLKNHPNLPEYKASKHALDGLSKSFRAQGMKISNIYPGLVNSKFNKRKGGMNSKDVAEAVYFLATSKENMDLYMYYGKD